MKRLVIGVIYIHPKSNLQEFQSAMENTIELLNSNSATYYITGDINIDLFKINHDVKISHYLNTHTSFDCSQIIAHPTRITAASSTLLDHIYTNNSSQHINSHTIIYDISDHLPVTALVKNFKLLNTPFRSYISEVLDFCNGLLHLGDNMPVNDQKKEIFVTLLRMIFYQKCWTSATACYI